MTDWDSGWDGGWAEAADGGDGAEYMALDDVAHSGMAELGSFEPSTRSGMSWTKGPSDIAGGLSAEEDPEARSWARSSDRRTAYLIGSSERQVREQRRQRAEQARSRRPRPSEQREASAALAAERARRHAEAQARQAELAQLLDPVIDDRFAERIAARMALAGADYYDYFEDDERERDPLLVEVAAATGTTVEEVSSFTQAALRRRSAPIDAAAPAPSRRYVSLAGTCPGCGAWTDSTGACRCSE